jgi:hypothetical protein
LLASEFTLAPRPRTFGQGGLQAFFNKAFTQALHRCRANGERCRDGIIRRASVGLEQHMRPGQLAGRHPAFLGQRVQLGVFVIHQGHNVFLGHRSLPFWQEHTTGKTRHRIYCGKPLEAVS